MLLFACAPGATEGGSKNLAYGRASASITLIPTGTLCIAITVVGPAPASVTVPFSFDVAPEASSVFALVGLPLGTDAFSASAYAATCAQSAGATPTYVSELVNGLPVTALVTANSIVPVTLQMGNGGGGTVGLNFPSPNTIHDASIAANGGPDGITTGPDGNVWFTETGAGKIGQIQLPDGTIFEYPASGNLGAPIAIAAGPDGNLWFTNNGVPTAIASTIGRISPAGGITEYPIPSSQSVPGGIAAGPDGNLWFTETNTNNIGRITPAGIFTEFAVPTPSSSPTDIAAGSDGNLWFTEATSGKVGKIQPADGSITEFTAPAGVHSSPLHIASGPDGNLWFTEASSGQVGKIQPDGGITEYPLPSPSSVPDGIAAGPDGNVWFTELAGDNIGRITPAGVISEFAVPTVGSGPLGISAGPDGALWFTEYNASKVGRISAF